MRLVSVLSLVGLLAGCASKSEVEALDARLAAIEAKLDELAKAPVKAAAAGPSDADEKAAAALYGEVNKLLSEDNIDGAKAKLKELMAKYGNTRPAARAKRIQDEIDVVGKSATSFGGNAWAQDWYVGASSDVDLTSGVDLVVFWEVWCPHCRREVPELQAMSEKYAGKMDIVGLTRLTRSSTPEKVKEFIEESKLTYPTAKEDGSVAAHFAVSGIPAAALVKDGTIVWRGHPGRLSEDTIAKHIN